MKKLMEEFIFKFCRFGIIPEQAPLEIDLLTNASVKIYELDTINLDYDVTIAMQRNFTGSLGKQTFVETPSVTSCL